MLSFSPVSACDGVEQLARARGRDRPPQLAERLAEAAVRRLAVVRSRLAPAASSIRAAEPSASATAISARASGRPRARAIAASAAGLSARNRMRWARERTVGSRRSGAPVQRTRWLPASGSSSVLSRPLAELGFIASASSTMITRAGASCGRVRVRARMARMSSMTICPPGPDGPKLGTSGWRPASMRRQTSQAPQPAPGATGQSSAIASPSAALRLPTPGGPSNT